MAIDLRQQYFAQSSPRATDVPENRLLWAVLLDAIIQLRSGDALDAIEAENWIRNDEITDSPFSFDNVCEVLGIQSDELSPGLLACRDRPAQVERRAPLRHVRASRARIA